MIKLRSLLSVLSFMLVSASLAPAAEPATASPGVPTVWLVGDSTVRNGTKGQRGWGDPFIKLFDESKVRVVNRAMGGRSSRSFQTEGRWDKVLEEAKAGDFVIIQMGHNDGGPLAGDNRERGSIKGTGDESETVTLTLGDNKGKQETVHTYGWYLRKYVADARAKGMTPIICSPVPRAPKAGEPVAELSVPGGYRLWSQEVAEKEKVPFIDLYGRTWNKYTKLSAEQIKKDYFTDADNTHTNDAGAQVNAESVAEGLKELTDLPLAGFLKTDGTK